MNETAGERRMSCAFCEIVAGDRAAFVVLDEPDVLGFLDVRPVFPGHVLVIPKQHVETLLELPATLHGPMLDAARRVAAALVAGLGAQGSFVAINNVVSQSVPHLHIHVVPRTKGDGLRGFFWPRTKYASDADAAAVAATLQGVLAPPDRRG